jgi:hypothetical protein
MSSESVEKNKDAFPRIGEDMMANLIQIRLMPIAFRIDHEGVDVNMADRDMRTQVGMEWAEKYAAAFREYIDDYPRETLNIHDDEALIEFLMKIKEYTTVH